MKLLSAAEVETVTVNALGLRGIGAQLLSQEALSETVRRAVGLLGPAPLRAIRRAILLSLEGLAPDTDELRSTIEDLVGRLVANSDLIEAKQNGESGTMLYPATPAFVVRENGSAIVLGVLPDHSSALPDELASRIHHRGYFRHLAPEIGEDLKLRLSALGLVELSLAEWSKAPMVESAQAYLNHFNALLNEGRPIVDPIQGLTLVEHLQKGRPHMTYLERTVDPRPSHSGCFVGRRPQAHGAPIWCFLRAMRGQPDRIMDLMPAQDKRLRGCDEAWRLIAALDAVQGHPQRVHVQRNGDHTTTLRIGLPPPIWLEHRWDALGERVSPSGFAYRFSDEEVDAELDFVCRMLWAQPKYAGAN